MQTIMKTLFNKVFLALQRAKPVDMYIFNLKLFQFIHFTHKILKS
jgi:hypothetical protein